MQLLSPSLVKDMNILTPHLHQINASATLYMGKNVNFPSLIGKQSIATHRFKSNIWDVGGQKSLRSYWRNYFESTDGLIWVVDSADRRRLADCKEELKGLLLEEVPHVYQGSIFIFSQSR